ncbi:MAG TPA: minichromosome maintenance protein MCM, partial [Thermoprotei archaeon]|nr:minichromosome maintenance protein MCM [Thermoprotei archaeon]
FDDLLIYDKELADEIKENPLSSLDAANKAVKDFIEVEASDYAQKHEHFNARFRGVPDIVPLRRLRSEHLFKLISVEGIVTKITPVKQLLYEAIFRCVECGGEVKVLQVGRGFSQPAFCPYCGIEEDLLEDSIKKKSKRRRKSNFELVLEKSKYIDWQKAVIQEKPEELPPGQLPRSLEVVLKEDLVDTIRPGDRVSVSGVLMVQQEYSLKKDKPPLFHTYLEANYIEASEKGFLDIEITPEDEKEILKLAEDPNIRERIIKSIAPSIYGYDYIKKAIALQLFGGEPKVLPDGVKIRGDIHILLVGDPGTAKSQLLRFVAQVAPRAVYTTGKGSTAAGLTAAVVRDKTTGDFYLEAGALVLADKGIACIDEIDKMDNKDRVSMHEAMEQQTVSIAKAGIVATLNARTAVLAAANPAFGRYLPQKTIVDNIDLPITILSRFDLIFVIVDTPNLERDKALTEHVLKIHKGEFPSKDGIIPIDLLKKYIAYARKNIRVQLSEKAMKKIEEFYLEMRSKSASPEAPVAITPRQLEALVRLTEAHARMALKRVATAEDAQAAIELMSYFLHNVGLDVETKLPDIDIILTGKPRSQQEKLVKLMELIKDMEAASDERLVRITELLEAAKEEGLEEDFVEKAIRHWKSEGIIYEPRPGYIRRVKA